MDRRLTCTFVGVLCLLIFFVSQPLLGQGASSIQGQITDESAAIVPGATVTLTNVARQTSRETITNDEGFYRFAQVSAGTYQLRIELPGFKTHIEEDVEIPISTPVTLDLVLELGEISEVVTVSSETARLNRTDASIGNTMGEKTIQNLPLLTRNIVQLLSLQPAVNSTGQVAGGRNDQNAVTLDGINVNDQQSSGSFESVLPIPLDSVQEFRVTTAGINADQGRSGGGQVAIQTRSGTNDWHGSVYEFHRNTKTAANSFFNNQSGVEREALIRNQFGFSVGGPIVQDRVFFFFNWERRMDRSGDAQSRTIPTTPVRNGSLVLRDSSGNIQTLTPDEMAIVDIAGIGVNPAMQQYWRSFPTCDVGQTTGGCDSNQGLDRGLSFIGYRFNAPQKRDDNAYVARFDFNISENHSVSWRGTLADNLQNSSLAQFPGLDARSDSLNNSRGFSTNYTAILTPTLTSNFRYGFTRQGIESTGLAGDKLSVRSYDEPFGTGPRAFGRKVPTHNIVEDLTWIKGNHTFQFGTNIRVVKNDRFTFGAGAFSTYSVNNGAIIGLGSDYYDSVSSYLAEREGDEALTAGASNPVIRAGMGIMGTITQAFFTFQFDRDGMAIPRGQSQDRIFRANEYEFYFQDQWRLHPNFTLTLGMRYSNDTVPWEDTGLQVATSNPLQNYWHERLNNSFAGIPSYTSDLLSFDLNGPVNGEDSWWSRDTNNWAPRVALAWSPNFDSGSLLGAIFGSGNSAVFRAGAGVVYDRFGSEMIVNFDSLGSVGVATEVSYPSFDFFTAPRFGGAVDDKGNVSGLPPAPAAPSGGFPNTPPLNYDIITNTFGIASDLRSPYSYLLNFNWARELGDSYTVELGYVGRLSKGNLAQLDIMSPLNLLTDSQGSTWVDAGGAGRALMEDLLNNQGLTLGSARRGWIVDNAASIAPINYVEELMPGLKDFFTTGSATANFHYLMNFGLQFSQADALHLIDRSWCTSPDGSCHNWFAEQYSTMPTWFNSGFSNYHAMTFSLRKRFSDGLGLDFNYTWSHSIDNESGAETGAGQFGGVILDAMNVSDSRGSSDFDIRQQFNANAVWELPFGQGQRFGSGMPGWANQIVGGWQLTGIFRYNTGLPASTGTGFNFSTNYFLTGRSYTPNGAPESKVTKLNNDGVPGLFENKGQALGAGCEVNGQTACRFQPQQLGQTGPRNIIRLDDFFNMDVALAKYFFMPWEGHRIQFRFEMFNALNTVNFTGVSLDPIDNPDNFGEFSNTTSPRIIQFALRYEF